MQVVMILSIYFSAEQLLDGKAPVEVFSHMVVPRLILRIGY